jgi:hypothetical protein
MIVGYARTSTMQEAGFETQLKQLKSAGCEKVSRATQSSGSNRSK